MVRKVVLLLFLTGLWISNAALSQVSSYVFSASQGGYTNITAGTTVTLAGNGTDPVLDEGYANDIPIGFNFTYLGASYTTINASTNGFASFEELTSAFFSNNLSTGIAPRPLLAPLWEDLSLSATTDMQYLTTGSNGSRVFVLQWSNVLYDFSAGAPAVSFQIRLYEANNKIEFVYSSLSGGVQDYSGGASIGITDVTTGIGSFLSLNNSSASAVASSVIATNNINTKPVTGQVYTFTPPACSAPGNLKVTGITTNSATVSWTDISTTAFEYTVTVSATPPASGANTSFTSALQGGLLPGTQYYLHVRKSCSGTFSGWASYPFATLSDTVSLPYTMPISSAIAPALPPATTASDVNQDGNTWRTYPAAGPGWTDQVIAYVYNNNGTTPANDWLFTSGFNLVGGTRYRLKFKYDNDAQPLFKERLKVAYGTTPAAVSMTGILADYTSVYSAAPKNASIDFTPATSGKYYIGFQAYSEADKDVLILDDISLSTTPSCDVPQNLAAIVEPAGTSVNVNWQAPAIGIATSYEYAVTSAETDPASGSTSSSASGFINNLIANANYYLHVRTGCGSTFSDWTTMPFATIANDESCRAIALISGAAPICGNTALATSVNDPYSNCSNPNNSLWYKFTPTVTGTVVLIIKTPAAPADPLRGWAAWYTRSGDCPNVSFSEISGCQQFGNDGSNDVDYLISPLLTAGVTYYIMIDGFSNDIGEFCINIPSCSPAINVDVEDITSTGATVNWSGTGSFLVEFGPTGFTPGTGLTAGTGGTIVNPAVSPQLINGLTLSTSYDVYVRQTCVAAGTGYSANSIVTPFTTLGPPPANDNCSGAVTLTVFDNECGGTTIGTTLNATGSGVTPIPQCNIYNTGYDDDVWYSFTPSAGQLFVNINFTYISGNADLVAQVYTTSDNTCSGTFIPYECSDDDGDENLPGFYSLPVTAGKRYFIRVFTLSRGVNSQFSICITRALLINDNVSGAINLEVDAPCTGAIYTNVGASQTPGEPTGSCSSLVGHASVWFKFVGPAGGAVRISTAMGTDRTLMNTRVALYSAGDLSNYQSFQVISCDEDGGSGTFDKMSVLYATGLTEGWTYYIEVDKFNNLTPSGTFCITVETLKPEMLATTNNCSSNYQVPVGAVSSYVGWVPLMDEESKLIALVANINGTAANTYSVKQNIKTGEVRRDAVSGEFYLNRNYKITNTTSDNATFLVQLFYLDTELAALQAMDPAAAVNRLKITRQSGTDCQPDFIAASGSNTELLPIGDGSNNGVSWIKFNTPGFSNFYIHSIRSRLTAKTFLQGAFNEDLNRHKDVTPAWANVLNTFARSQPYNIPAFGNYSGTESVPAGFFKSSPADTDIVDWVLLEVKNAAGSIISRRAAFIREDGMIVDLDGVSPVSIYGQGAGLNNVVIRHRNHLAIRTSSQRVFAPLALGISPPVLPLYDFTTSQSKAYQNPSITSNVAMAQHANTFMMWGGNANMDSTVRVTTLLLSQGDPVYIVGNILAGNPNTVLSTIYSPADVNMDAIVRINTLLLTKGERPFILGTVFSGVSSAILREHK
jgi:hypothetical protein